MKPLNEEEKRIVTQTINSPFWPIFVDYIEEQAVAFRVDSESALGPDLTSILEREQLIGAAKHFKYLITDFQNYVKTQNQTIT